MKYKSRQQSATHYSSISRPAQINFSRSWQRSWSVEATKLTRTSMMISSAGPRPRRQASREVFDWLQPMQRRQGSREGFVLAHANAKTSTDDRFRGMSFNDVTWLTSPSDDDVVCNHEDSMSGKSCIISFCLAWTLTTALYPMLKC